MKVGRLGSVALTALSLTALSIPSCSRKTTLKCVPAPQTLLDWASSQISSPGLSLASGQMVKVDPKQSVVGWVVAASLQTGQQSEGWHWMIFGVDDVAAPVEIRALNGVTADISGWPGPGSTVFQSLDSRHVRVAEQCLGVS